MLVSNYQIDFITDSGVTTRLLSIGDLTTDTLEFPMQIQTEDYTIIGADWGGAVSMGGSRRGFSWVTVREHANHAEAASYCLRHPATLPIRTPGKLRVTVDAGEVWDFLDAVLSTAAPRQWKDGDFATYTAYQASAGEIVPVSTLTLYAGIPWNFILQNWEDITTHWENI